MYGRRSCKSMRTHKASHFGHDRVEDSRCDVHCQSGLVAAIAIAEQLTVFHWALKASLRWTGSQLRMPPHLAQRNELVNAFFLLGTTCPRLVHGSHLGSRSFPPYAAYVLVRMQATRGTACCCCCVPLATWFDAAKATQERHCLAMAVNLLCATETLAPHPSAADQPRGSRHKNLTICNNRAQSLVEPGRGIHAAFSRQFIQAPHHMMVHIQMATCCSPFQWLKSIQRPRLCQLAVHTSASHPIDLTCSPCQWLVVALCVNRRSNKHQPRHVM